jgi:hypothetical protein
MIKAATGPRKPVNRFRKTLRCERADHVLSSCVPITAARCSPAGSSTISSSATP